MIQDINHLSVKQDTSNQILTNLINGSDVQNKEAMLALSKIQLGDVLSGKIISQEDQTLLKLENGLKLLAQIPQHIMSDRLLDFLVVGKSRQHLELECVQKNHALNKEQDIESAVIKEMQLPQNQEMKQLVGKWIDGQLPLVKNQLLQVYHLAKHYDLPSEALINIKGQAGALSEQEMQLVKRFRNEGMQVLNHLLDEIFETMGHSEGVELTSTLSQYSPNDSLKQMITQTLEQMIKSTKSQDGLLTHNVDKENLLSSKAMLDSVMKEAQQLEFESIDSMKEKIEVLKNGFQFLSKEELKELAKQFGHKHLAVHQKDLMQHPQELEKLDEVSDRLKEIIEDVKPYVKQEGTSQILSSLEQMAQALDKYQVQGQYYCFPLQINDQQTTGELYFFKPKKNKKGNQVSNGMYIVLALDMPSLKHIEIHLKEEKDKLGLKIKVTNDEILKHMQNHKKELRTLMEDTIVPIGEIHLECLKQTAREKISKKEDGLNRLDFRI